MFKTKEVLEADLMMMCIRAQNISITHMELFIMKIEFDSRCLHEYEQVQIRLWLCKQGWLFMRKVAYLGDMAPTANFRKMTNK